MVVVVMVAYLVGWLVWLPFVSAGLDVVFLASRREGKSHQGGDMVNLPLVDEGLHGGGHSITWGAVTTYIDGGGFNVSPTPVVCDRN